MEETSACVKHLLVALANTYLLQRLVEIRRLWLVQSSKCGWQIMMVCILFEIQPHQNITSMESSSLMMTVKYHFALSNPRTTASTLLELEVLCCACGANL